MDEQPKRKVVEQLVRDNHAGEWFSRHDRDRRNASGVHGALCGGNLHGDVSERCKTQGFRSKHRASKGSRTGTSINNDVRVGTTKLNPPSIEGPGDHRPEERPDFW